MVNDAYVHEDMLQMINYNLLPDLFLMNDVRRVSSVFGWQQRSEEIRKTAMALLGGRFPPEPEFLQVEAPKTKAYRITEPKRPLHFRMQMILPDRIIGKCPVFVDGDQRFSYREGYLEAALSE